MASCSGTLIGPDLWATAGHCISGDSARGACRPGVLTDYTVVFDYTDGSNNVFPEDDVYEAIEVVHCVVDDSYCYGNSGVTVDWAVLRLDRQVVGRTPVTVQPSVAEVGDPVYIVGHPSGLPRKYTSHDGAEILQIRAGPRDSRDHANVHTVVTNLDSFSGNSGSGVFNGITNEMVGILVEGGQDWEVTSAGCSVAHTCRIDPLQMEQQGCPGEEVVSSTVLLPFLLDQAGCASDADCNAGTCTGGVCECAPDFYGPDCSFKCERAYCNNRGTCVGYDQCECDDGALWPPLCSADRRECQEHANCGSGAYCSQLGSSRVCWECTDCEGRTCEDWGDSVDGSCARCDGTAPPPVPVERGAIECGDTVTGNTALALSQVGQESGENLFVFSLDSPRYVHFDSCDSSFDTFLRVMSEDLRIEYAECDDCGPCGHQSVLDVVLEPGTYALLVEGYGSAEGAYEIQMACTNATDVPHLAETVGSCTCMPTWSVSSATCDDSDATYHGCHAPPCDGDTGGIEGQSWCMIETRSGCNPVGVNWDYCVPGNWVDVSAIGDSAEELAQNSCGWAYDNECDEPMYCEFGTDTADCSSGAPLAGSGNMQWGSPADSCLWAHDGECDDPMFCAPGTDTTDCALAANFTHIPFELVDLDGDISCGMTVDGTTDGAGSHVGNRGGDHVYFFDVEDGTENIQFDSCGSEMDTFLRVMDHDLSTEFAACDDCGPCGVQTVLDLASLGVTLEPGSYALVVEGYSYNEGHYSVEMNCVLQDQGGTDLYDGRVDCGTTVSGDTSAGMWQSHVQIAGNDASEHIYLFTIPAGGMANIEFDSCDSEFDTWLLVMTPDLSTEITGCDDCGPCDTRSVLQTGPLEEGEYALVIEGWASSEGRYAVTMTCQSSQNSTFFDGTIECDGTVDGTTSGSEVHAYTFFVPEPGVWNLEFNSCGSSFDTHLQVVGGENYGVVFIGCDDCGPCDTKAVLDTGFLPAGEYAVEISSSLWFFSPQSSGDYSLSMSCFTGAADVTYYDGRAVCDEQIDGDTSGAGSHRGNDASDHMYIFDVADGGVSNIEFNSCGSEFDTHLRVLSHDLMTEIASCDDCGDCEYASILDTGGLDGGTYVLLVEGYSNTEGTYTISTTCQNATEDIQFYDGNVECGDTIEGDTFEEGSHRGHESGDHIYYFSVPTGETINVEFDSCASDFDTHLRVFDHDLTEEYAECDDCGECDNRSVLNVALSTGEYALLVEGYWYAEGRYQVQMICSSEAENDASAHIQAYFPLLVGNTQDVSGRGRTLTLSGHSHVGIDGATFDGNGDDITISNFEYAADGTFSVSFWFTKEQCNDAMYEYLYSHHESADPSNAFDLSFVNVYIGCENQGGGWSTLGGTVLRYFVKDTVGTEAMFDFNLHSAGNFDEITNVWVHTIWTVSPTSLATYDDGQLVDDNEYGSYMSRPFATNAAMPEPYHLDPELVTPGETGQPTFDLQQDITIGGRSDRNVDRHFHGRMALVSVYSHNLTPGQAAFSFREGAEQMAPVIDAGSVRDSALLDVWFVLGENGDRSVICHDALQVPRGEVCHRIQAHGNAAYSDSGVSFSGVGDDITIDSFDYHTDGTFAISYWFTKEFCTDSVFEYLFSHHHQVQDTWEFSYVDSYLGCEQNLGGFTSVGGTVVRHWIRDAFGTEATFDYSLHSAGDFDEITSQWIHNIFSVTRTGLLLFNGGRRLSDGDFGFHLNMNNGQDNSAYPTPSALGVVLAEQAAGGGIFDMSGPIFLGGRADRNLDRHFHGRMAMVRIYDHEFTEYQANIVFQDNEVILQPLACNMANNFVSPETFECIPFSVPACECLDEYDTRCEYELMPRRRHGDRLCDIVRQCDGTEEYEVAQPSLTTDRRCELHSLCSTGEFESVRGTATRDTVCEAMIVCDPQTEYESKPPEQRPCRHESAYCATSNRECSPITPACDTSHEWQYLGPTRTTDRVCRELTVCEDGEIEAEAPTETSDRVCAMMPGAVACHDGQFIVDYGPPLSCRSVRTCTSLEFESSAPTEAADRVCEALTVCNRDEDEIAAPVLNSGGLATTDRVCERRSCTANEYDNGNMCAPLTECRSSEYEDTPPEPDADRHCTALTVCTDEQYESTPPSTRRDRVCLARVACSPGQVLVGSERCESCPAGTEDADSDDSTPCTPCPDGTSSVAGSIACSSNQVGTVVDAFEIEGAVVEEEALVAAITEVVSSLDSVVTVEVVSYEQRLATSLSVDGRPLSDFSTATPEGTALINELRSWIASTLGIPVDSVRLQTQRRLRRALAEGRPDTDSNLVELRVEIIADRDVSGRLTRSSSFGEGVAEQLDLPADAVTVPEGPEVSTRIVTRVNFEAHNERESDDHAVLLEASVLLSHQDGGNVEQALRRQAPGRYEELELHAELPQVLLAENGSIHREGADNVLVEIRPATGSGDLRSSHELHDMDNEIKIIEVFLGLLGIMCLCGCACVCIFRVTKPKPLTDEDLDRGFGAVLQTSVGPVGGVDPEMEVSDKRARHRPSNVRG